MVKQALPAIDYWDAFEVEPPGGTFGDVDSLTHACSTLPPWVQVLMSLRNRLVRRFGLKTELEHGVQQAAHGARIEPGDSAGIFKVLARSADEILMGLDDRHLDFRFSLLLRGAESQTATATTLVHFHNVWGRLYFFFVKPVHRLIIPAMLRSAVRHAR